ncbi:hypothetical protein Vretifemale_5574 [Volvox reticuliferus]|nr:hypothetical protein Vretifemale_5574 [Volvox reticuliferus]
MPLAVSGSGGGWEGEWPADVTASRLAGAAAALGRDGAAAAGGPGELLSTLYGGAAPAAAAGGGPRADTCAPCWRIVHHADIWHNVPLVWWRLRRALCVAMDALLGPLLRV